MTALPDLDYTWDTTGAHVGRVTLTGDLVNVNAEQVLRSVSDQLSAHPGLRELHIDCAGLETCDSRGLSILLMLRRRTDAMGVVLHLVHRSRTLNRLLERTGTAEYLTGASSATDVQDQEPFG